MAMPENRLLIRALGPRRLRNLLLALGAGMAAFCLYYASRENWIVVAGAGVVSASLLGLALSMVRSPDLPPFPRLFAALCGINLGAVVALITLGAIGVAWFGPLVFVNLLLGGAIAGGIPVLVVIVMTVYAAGLYTDLDLTANIVGALLLSATMAFAVMVGLRDRVGRLQRRAEQDPLTGAGNRYGFTRMLTSRLAMSHEEDPLSLIILDLDRFKQLNDERGHPAGDAVLKTLVRLLSNTLRSDDHVYRYGGEEFAVLVDARGEEAMRVAEKLRRAVAGYDFGDGLRVTLSAGVGEAMPMDTEQSLVDRVDQALYRAKGNGRNRCELADTDQVA
jgi:diguanylate cyclase (GGDEF)-like protein